MSYFVNFLAEFGLEPSTDDTRCSGKLSFFPKSGAADVPGYWRKDWSSDVPACKLASYETPYSIYARDDYKRCVCDLYGEGEKDCPNGSELDVETVKDEFEEIENNPFEPEKGPSRSFSQIERELDLIENTLFTAISILQGKLEVTEEILIIIDELEEIR